LSQLKAQRPEAVYIVTTAAISSSIERIIESVARLKIPTTYTNPMAVKQGGLTSYTADYAQLTQRCAVIAGRILKGANPRDLPVEQATKYVLMINLKTAKALGLTMPQTLLSRACIPVRVRCSVLALPSPSKPMGAILAERVFWRFALRHLTQRVVHLASHRF